MLNNNYSISYYFVTEWKGLCAALGVFDVCFLLELLQFLLIALVQWCGSIYSPHSTFFNTEHTGLTSDTHGQNDTFCLRKAPTVPKNHLQYVPKANVQSSQIQSTQPANKHMNPFNQSLHNGRLNTVYSTQCESVYPWLDCSLLPVTICSLSTNLPNWKELDLESETLYC